MFKEYQVVFRASIMTTENKEKAAIDQVHYLMASMFENIDGVLIGHWSLETLPREKENAA